MSDRPPAAYAAVDLGASSGRVMLGFAEADEGADGERGGAAARAGRRVRMTEVHRFANGPHPESLAEGATLRWDVDRLFEETLTGLAAAVRVAAEQGLELAGIGVDSWGVDYAILPSEGAWGHPRESAAWGDPSESAAWGDPRASDPSARSSESDSSGDPRVPDASADPIAPSPGSAPSRALPPVNHYRGADLAGPAEAESVVTAARVYALSGVPPQPINTSYRLRADRAARAARLDGTEPGRADTGGTEPGGAEPGRTQPGGTQPDGTEAGHAQSDGTEAVHAQRDGAAPGGTVLLVPDLWVHLLSGDTSAERTIASTTQLLDAQTGEWSAELVEALGLIAFTLPGTVAPGARAGVTLPWVAERIGAAHPVPVFHVAEHDTASALAFAEPDGGQLLVSSGSWSLVGLSVSAPVLTDEAFAAGLTNEHGVGDSTLVLRNLAGLWLLVECTRQWSREAGRILDPVDLVRQAIDHPGLAAPVFDVGDERLLTPGDMPQRIARLCLEAGQPAPDGVLGTVRSIVESLAVAYAESVELLAAATGIPVRSVRIVGGGSRNELLCRRTADLTGLPVMAGPAEASAFGNLAVQLVAAGEFRSLAEVYAAGGEAGGEIARYEPSAARQRGSSV